jgi:hypothetical protein
MTLSFSSSQQSLPELFAVDRGHVSVFSAAENSANNRNVQNPKTINNQNFIMGFFFLEFGKNFAGFVCGFFGISCLWMGTLNPVVSVCQFLLHVLPCFVLVKEFACFRLSAVLPCLLDLCVGWFDCLVDCLVGCLVDWLVD